MEAEQQQEWSNLRCEAHGGLRNGFPQSRMDQRVVQVVEMPSFQSWTSWELYEQRRGMTTLNSAVLVEAVWRVDIDADKLRDPVTRLRYPLAIQPTISVNVSNVAEDFLLLTVSELRELVVPVNPGPAPLLLDGTAFEMTAGNGFAVVTYHWSESPPDRWLALHAWASRWITMIRAGSVMSPA